MNYEQNLDAACAKFRKILENQLTRVEDMKSQGDFTDYSTLKTIKIGVCGGDGIGPTITKEARRVLEFMLSDLVESGKVEFTTIDGLTIENRIAAGKAIPDDVMAELKACDIILKGPTTTPQKGDGMPNIESANVAMRKALDLFANIRPVKVPEEGINWTIFRENTEGGYAVGSSGFNVTDDLAVDFTITTKQGSDRIARLAYDYACASCASNFSAYVIILPNPLFKPLTRISTTPPAVSPSVFSWVIFSFAVRSIPLSSIPSSVSFARASSAKEYSFSSFTPQTSFTYPPISTPSTARYCV